MRQSCKKEALAHRQSSPSLLSFLLLSGSLRASPLLSHQTTPLSLRKTPQALTSPPSQTPPPLPSLPPFLSPSFVVALLLARPPLHALLALLAPPLAPSAPAGEHSIESESQNASSVQCQNRHESPHHLTPRHRNALKSSKCPLNAPSLPFPSHTLACCMLLHTLAPPRTISPLLTALFLLSPALLQNDLADTNLRILECDFQTSSTYCAALAFSHFSH